MFSSSYSYSRYQSIERNGFSLLFTAVRSQSNKFYLQILFTNFIAVCIILYTTVWRRNRGRSWYFIVYFTLNAIKQQVDKMPGNGSIAGVFYTSLKCNAYWGKLSEFHGACPACSAASECTEGFHANVLQITIFSGK